MPSKPALPLCSLHLDCFHLLSTYLTCSRVLYSCPFLMSSSLLNLTCPLHLNFPHDLFTWTFLLSSVYVNCLHVLYTKKGGLLQLWHSQSDWLTSSTLDLSHLLTWPVLHIGLYILFTWPVLMSWLGLSCMLASMPELSSYPLYLTCPNVLTWPVLHVGLYAWTFFMSSLLDLPSCLTCLFCMLASIPELSSFHLYLDLSSCPGLACPAWWPLCLNFPHVLFTWPVLMSWPDLSCTGLSVPELVVGPVIGASWNTGIIRLARLHSIDLHISSNK